MILKIVACCLVSLFVVAPKLVAEDWMFKKLQQPRTPAEPDQMNPHYALSTVLWPREEMIPDHEVQENLARAYRNAALDAILKNRAFMTNLMLEQHLQNKKAYAESCLRFMSDLAKYETAKFQYRSAMKEAFLQLRH